MPNPVKTIAVQGGIVHTASLSPLPSDSRKLTPAPATANPATVTTVATVKRDPPPPPPLPGATPSVLGTLPVENVVKVEKVASTSGNVPLPATEPAPKVAHGGWMIQVGAFDEEKDAKQRLTMAQSKAKDQLDNANPFTERVAKGDKALFRARFAGLEKTQAEAACKHLKLNEIPCMLLKN
jgi:D-alanyl-D-alanine carboxypeptidase